MFALLGRRSRIPTAPKKQRRFSWSKKRSCCKERSSSLPRAPVPLLTMPDSSNDATRKKKSMTRTAHPKKINTTLKRAPKKSTSQNEISRTTSATTSSTKKTDSSSNGNERVMEKRKVMPSTSATRMNRSRTEIGGEKRTVRRTKVDGSVGGASSRRSGLSSSRTLRPSEIVDKNPSSSTRSERRTPRSFPTNQRRLQSPRSSLDNRPKTNKPIVKSIVSDGSRTKTSLSSSELMTSTRQPEERKLKEPKKPRIDRKPKGKKAKESRPSEVTSRLESKPSVKHNKTATKPEMSLWKRLKKQMTTNKQKTVSNSADPKKRRSWRRTSDPGASCPPPGDTDADSVSTGLPILAKRNPEDVFFPITPRSLALTNVNEDMETSPQRGVLQRCTTLSPEPNPDAVFRQFQGCSELRAEQKEETLYTVEPQQDTEMDASGRRVFTPGGLKVTQKDTTYSSASAEILRTHSSGSTSVCQIEGIPKGSPRRVFSNPLLSPSPELQPYPTNLDIPISMGLPDLRIPNMPTIPRSDASETLGGGGTSRRLDSSQIEARCEWIRETLKEESQRLITMTTMLEGLQVSPRPAASAEIKCATNQDLNRRYIERINDLQLENRHLRQLLDFSIGSMRRQSWIPGPAPVTPSCGLNFSNPIAEIEDAGKSFNKREAVSKPQTKGKKPRNGPEYVAQLQNSLESKKQLLKVVNESYTQIASLESWYDKRLTALDKDRKRLQAERTECLKELKRCGTEVRGQQSRKKKPLQPTSLSRSLDLAYKV